MFRRVVDVVLRGLDTLGRDVAELLLFSNSSCEEVVLLLLPWLSLLLILVVERCFIIVTTISGFGVHRYDTGTDNFVPVRWPSLIRPSSQPLRLNQQERRLCSVH
jgi:hypothetical protein